MQVVVFLCGLLVVMQSKFTLIFDRLLSRVGTPFCFSNLIDFDINVVTS